MVWRVALLGGISAVREETILTHFESSRAMALLARLTLFPQRTHPREELCELLWPEIEPEIGRRRLRHLLGTLRKPLEAGLPVGSILVADRNSVRINPEAVSTDVAAFELALQKRDYAAARALYTGELLPGLWDDWIVEERHRLEALAATLTEAATPSASPATLPSAPRATALPPYLTRFFGRVEELAQLAELTTRARLVTLAGLGGTGKSRLATEVLRQTVPRFEYTAFVALAECMTSEQVPGRIRAALGLPRTEADPLNQIVWHLADSPTLLLLDNFEQLVDSGGGELIASLLERLPSLTFLITSRRTLGLDGERLLPLEPLPMADAMALFLDRVQASRPGFRLTDGNRDDIEAVCSGLDGIPLALELAAARIRAFTPKEMRRELDSRFEWLARTGLRGEKDDRHRSLSAALEWSWRLLSASQQRFLSQLALFRAPFRASDAAAITGYSDARERLESLETDSLAQSRETESGETCYALLETVREFALPHLSEARDARSRFRAHYIAKGFQEANAAVAWEYALVDEAPDDAYAFAARLETDWSGLLGVGRARDFLERTRAMAGGDPEKRIFAAYQHAHCLTREGDRQGAVALMAEAVAPLEEQGGEVLAEGLRLQAIIGQFDVPNALTLSLLDRCLSLTQNPRQRADALRLKGSCYLWTTDFDSAEPFFDEAQRLYPPEDRGLRYLLDNRALLASRRGQHEESLRLNRLATDAARAAGDTAMVRNCQTNRAQLLGQLERWEEALAQGLKCLEVEATHGDRFQLMGLLWNLAFPLLKTGDQERAAKLMAAIAKLWTEEIRPLDDEENAELDAFRADLAQHLDAATLTQLWTEGERLSLKDAIALVSQR